MSEHIMDKLIIRPLTDVSEKLSKCANEYEVRVGTLSALTERCNRLETENAKLREYAKAYLASVRFSCEPCPYCAPDSCEPETLPLRDGCRLYEEMRELGIEVDDDN